LQYGVAVASTPGVQGSGTGMDQDGSPASTAGYFQLSFASGPAPDAMPDWALTPLNSPVAIDVLGNDRLLTVVKSVTGLKPAEAGIVTIAADQMSVVFTPAPEWFGTVTFTYTAIGEDNIEASTTGTVTVTPDVVDPPVVDPPVVTPPVVVPPAPEPVRTTVHVTG